MGQPGEPDCEDIVIEVCDGTPLSQLGFGRGSIRAVSRTFSESCRDAMGQQRLECTVGMNRLDLSDRVDHVFTMYPKNDLSYCMQAVRNLAEHAVTTQHQDFHRDGELTPTGNQLVEAGWEHARRGDYNLDVEAVMNGLNRAFQVGVQCYDKPADTDEVIPEVAKQLAERSVEAHPSLSDRKRMVKQQADEYMARLVYWQNQSVQSAPDAPGLKKGGRTQTAASDDPEDTPSLNT